MSSGKNSLINCSIGPYNLKYKGYICDIQCPKELPYEMIEIQECIENCNINDIIQGKCKINYIDKSSNDKKQDEQLDEVRNMITKELNISNLDKGDNIIFKDDNVMYSLKTSNNNKRNEKINYTDIDLGDCEIELKKEYNITKEKSLYLIYTQKRSNH